MKLNELGIISDSDITTQEEGRKLFNNLVVKMDNLLNDGNIENKKNKMIAAISMFYAKIYLNYNWSEIMNTKEISVFGVERFQHDNFSCFENELMYSLPYLGKEFFNKITRTYFSYVKRITAFFHHDRLINGIPGLLEDNFTLASEVDLLNSEDGLNFIDFYNSVVLGSKIFIAFPNKSVGEVEEV